MKMHIVPSFAKRLYERFAAGIHAFVHPNEVYEHQRREYSLALALAEARQSAADAHRCAEKFRDRAHRSEEKTQRYKDCARLQQRQRADEIFTFEHHRFKCGYEREHVDSVQYRDPQTYDKGHGDGYPACIHDEQRLEVAPKISHGDQCGKLEDDGIQSSDSLKGDSPHREDLQAYHLHGPREMGSPSRQPRRNEKRPESRSPRKPFFPWHGDVNP